MILRFIYRRFRKRFHDFFMDDLLADIPPKVTEQAIVMLAEKRDVVTKWLYYQAHTISRRDITDFVSMERKLGILTQIKLMLIILGNAPRGEEDHPVIGKTVAPPEDWKAPIERFKKREMVDK